MSIRSIVILLAVLVCAGWSWADRGSVPFRPHVKIFEPNQRALIGWDGHEEILILSTDLRASEPTRVLEVIPFPCEPTVKKSSVEVFHRATEQINAALRAGAPSRSKSSSRHREPAGEITFAKRIGSHDVKVVRVRNGAGFVSWVENHLRTHGADQVRMPPVLRDGVEEYIEQGFTWFVFDVVDLGTASQTRDAIQYRFKTNQLFYPLKISRTDSGPTDISLIVLTPKMLRDFPGLPIDRVLLMHEPATLNEEQVKKIDADLHDLLLGSGTTQLRVWRVTGDLEDFDEDLIAR